jgi:AAA domain
VPPHAPPAPLLRYLRDCYRADAGGAAVHDLFDRKVEHLRFFDREVLLNAELPRRPLHAADVAPAAKAAALYRRERSLVYFAWPLVGQGTAAGGRPVRLCAPLLLYPATLHPGEPPDDDLFWLEVDLAEQRVNAAALEALLGPGAEVAVDELPARLPLPPFDLLAAADLAVALAASIPGLASPDLAPWPQLETGEEVRAARAERDGTPRLLRAAGLALISNPPDSGGILHELEALAGTGPPYSPPLSLLLGPPPPVAPAGQPEEPPAAVPWAPVRLSTVPVVLSASQNRALAAAARCPLSVIVGPPGTGKSTTLAALVLEHLGRGESVLVAARTPQALDVLEEKIGSLLGAPAPGLRADRGPALAALKDRLEELLSGRLPVPERPDAELDRELRHAGRRLGRQERRLERLAGLEVQWGELAGEPGALAGLARAWTGWRLRGEPPLWELLEAYQDRLAGHGRLAAAALRAGLAERASLGTAGRSGFGRAREATRDRAALRTLLAALRARQSARQLDLFDTLDPRRLLAALPLWLVPFADLHRALPLVPGLFDLAVIDEATQCDLATGLPALARARRAVVTGDPRQLRHLSFLSRARQGALGERHGLAADDVEVFDYRGRSLLDRALEALESPEQAVFLDEHFRSAPGLVAFSNREFYGGALRVMTRRPATLARRCLELRPGPGRREADGANPEEAERLVAELAARLAAAAADPAAGPARTFGVLSPFRGQVELLERRIAELLPLAAIERHRLRVGTPYAFQGDERDEMLLSLVLDDAAPAGAFRYLERPDVWNVAVTRARHRQVVFTSLSPGRAPAGTLLRRYLEAAAEEPAPAPALAPASPPGGRMTARLAAELRQAGLAVWPAFEVAGTAVDLLVEDPSTTEAVGERSLAVDLIGFPEESTAPFGLDRCRMLRRAGLPVFPLPARLWARNPAACLAALRQRLAAPPGD